MGVLSATDHAANTHSIDVWRMSETARTRGRCTAIACGQAVGTNPNHILVAPDWLDKSLKAREDGRQQLGTGPSGQGRLQLYSQLIYTPGPVDVEQEIFVEGKALTSSLEEEAA